MIGKHAELVCDKCHKGTDFRRPIAHQRCQDCHEDRHHGQFATRQAGSDCSSCHSETGFKPSKFDRETHRLGVFPLEGKHALVECGQCHQPDGEKTAYITGKVTCPACHNDRHAGEFAGPPWMNRCDQCHTPAGFQPTTFSASRHAGFALTGKHASVDCHACHQPLAVTLAPSAAPPRQYHFTSRACNTCHNDPHQTKVRCETCHTTEEWKAVLPFDHSTTKFKIESAHQNAKCLQCHGVEGKTAPVFSETRSQCGACHEIKDVHGGQFRTASREEDCSTCHTPTRWNSGEFNHDRTKFPMDVAHRTVGCAKCHREELGAGNRVFRKYRDTPTDCVKCH